jgi:hypothetical protein
MNIQSCLKCPHMLLKSPRDHHWHVSHSGKRGYKALRASSTGPWFYFIVCDHTVETHNVVPHPPPHTLWCWGLNLGPHCMLSKHSTNLATSPALVFFETGSHYVAPADLGLLSSCLHILSAEIVDSVGITDVSHHTWLTELLM